jgi:hypothetical protein
MATSIVKTPGKEWVKSPNSIAPGTALAAKYVTSGANEPATSSDGTSAPRPVPSRRTAGSTAAAWLIVNGTWSPSDGS